MVRSGAEVTATLGWPSSPTSTVTTPSTTWPVSIFTEASIRQTDFFELNTVNILFKLFCFKKSVILSEKYLKRCDKIRKRGQMFKPDCCSVP
jgi:hypothetical protein